MHDGNRLSKRAYDWVRNSAKRCDCERICCFLHRIWHRSTTCLHSSTVMAVCSGSFHSLPGDYGELCLHRKFKRWWSSPTNQRKHWRFLMEDRQSSWEAESERIQITFDGDATEMHSSKDTGRRSIMASKRLLSWPPTSLLQQPLSFRNVWSGHSSSSSCGRHIWSEQVSHSNTWSIFLDSVGNFWLRRFAGNKINRVNSLHAVVNPRRLEQDYSHACRGDVALDHHSINGEICTWSWTNYKYIVSFVSKQAFPANDALKREVIHVLCTGAKPFSQLERYIVHPTYYRKELLHDAVSAVGDFRRPLTSTTMGVFSLKPEFRPQYNPFFYHYQKVQISAGKRHQKANLTCGLSSWAVPEERQDKRSSRNQSMPSTNLSQFRTLLCSHCQTGRVAIAYTNHCHGLRSIPEIESIFQWGSSSSGSLPMRDCLEWTNKNRRWKRQGLGASKTGPGTI